MSVKRTIRGLQWQCKSPGLWWSPEKKILAERHFEGSSNEEWIGYQSEDGDIEKIDRCDYDYYSLTFSELARDVSQGTKR